MSASILRQAWQQLRVSIPRPSMVPTSSKHLLCTSAVARSAWDALLFPDLGNRKPHSPESIWAKNSDLFFQANDLHGVRNAYTGRSIAVTGGDVAAAATKLDRIVGGSGIAREWWTNRRHKPKGEERRKLASTRWRKRFKLEVGKKVALVRQIRRRGA